ncbi:MAG: pyridoxal phosphate-dependent decarboxylase family protein [Bacteroidales bacterium]
MLDPKDFKDHSGPVIEWIDGYLNRLRSLPVKSKAGPGEIYRQIPEKPPLSSESLDAMLMDLEKVILPGMTHWQHPNFHAYFPANNSVESILAEFITSAMGAQCMIWDTSPAAAELEQRMMEWLRDATGLPSGWEGVIQDSASSATLAALITAREVKTGYTSNAEGVPGNLRVYGSTETHSSVEKAVGVAGLGRNNFVKVATDDRMRMDTAALEKRIREDLQQGFVPCAVVATIGTTGTLAVDPLEAIGGICRKYDLWLHVDAAYAGTALMMPEYRWMIRGAEQVDSFVFNPHKWMFTNFDCSAYFVKDADALIRSFEILPEYLKTSSRGSVNDYRDWGIQLGRRFRALKLWFVIRSYGMEGIREKLEHHLELNRYFAEELRKIPGMVVPLEPFLNVTCFRYDPDPEADTETRNNTNATLLERINRSGDLFLSHTRIRGLHTARMVIGQTYVKREDVENALNVINAAIHK